MVGGESPHLDLDYYLDLVRSLQAALPDVTLKCFTASEIHHMTKLSGLSHEEVLKELFAAGLEHAARAAAPRCSPTACARSSRPARSIPTSGSRCTASRTAWA